MVLKGLCDEAYIAICLYVFFIILFFKEKKRDEETLKLFRLLMVD